MNLNYTLKSADYNEKTGESIVKIETDIGIFTGSTKLHKEDKPYASSYFGCEIAEWKAIEKYCKAKAKQYFAELNALQRFWRAMQGTRSYNVDAYWVKRIRQEVDDKKTRYKYWKDKAAKASDIRREKIHNRPEALSWLEKRKGKNN